MSRLRGFWGLIVKTNISGCRCYWLFFGGLDFRFFAQRLEVVVTKYLVHFVQLTFCTEVGGLSLMCYKILQAALLTFWTEVGGLPFLVSLQIWTTSLKSGKPLVSSLEWISWPLSLTSKEERRPTNPETCASGRDAKMAFDNSLKRSTMFFHSLGFELLKIGIYICQNQAH